MPLSEKDAITVRNNFNLLGEEEKTAASEWMRRYAAQQEDFGIPLYPSEVTAQQKKEQDFQAVFADPKALDATNGLYAEADKFQPGKGDELRQREANTLFLQRMYSQVDPDTVRRDYPRYRDDYAMNHARAKPGMSDGEFFGIAKTKVEAEASAKIAFEEGAKASLSGMGTLDAMAGHAQNAMDNPDKGPENDAFFKGYTQANAILAPHSTWLRSAADATARLMDGKGTPEDEQTIKDAKETLMNMPGQQRKLAISALRLDAEKRGADVSKEKGSKWSPNIFRSTFWQQAGESAYRFGENALTDNASVQTALDTIPDSGEVKFSGKAITTPEEARQYVSERISRMWSDKLSAQSPTPEANSLGGDGKNTITLDAKSTKLIQDAKARMERKMRLDREMTDIGAAADPVPNVIASTLGTSGAIMGAMALSRGTAAPMLANAYSNAEYNDLSAKYPMMSHADKQLVAGTSGAIQSALDYVGVKGFSKLNVGKLLMNPAGLGASVAVRGVTGAALSYGIENLVEGGQDIATPALIQALKLDVPGFDWEQEKKDFWKGRSDVAIGMIPLTLIGLGTATANDYQNGKALLASRDLMGQQGLSEKYIVPTLEAAQNGELQKAQEIYREGFANRSPEIAAEYQSQIDARQQEQSVAADELTRLGMLPDIRADKSGWHVTDTTTGTTATFPTWNDARQAATAHMNEVEQQQTDLVAHMADSFLAGTPDTLKGGESFDIRPQSVSLGDRVRSGQMTAEHAMEAAVAGGVVKGLSIAEARQIASDVFGESQEERTMTIRREVERIMVLGSNKMQNGQSQNTVNTRGNEAPFLTIVEEGVEGRWKAALAAGRFDKAQGVRWVQMAEAATGEQFLQGMTHDEVLASSESSPLALTEAISRIVTADVLGRLQDGKRIGPGAVSRGLNLADREQSALAAILNAFRQLFATILNTAAKLMKARKEGKLGAEYDQLFDHLTGDGSRWEHENGTVAEAEAMAKEAGGTETNSLRSGNFQARVDAVYSSFAKTPEKRLTLVQVAQDRVQKELDKLREIFDARSGVEQQQAEGEIRHAEAVAKLRDDLEADEAKIRQDRDFELKAITQDKGTELDRERIRREADNALKQRRIQFERELAAVDTRLASGELKSAKDTAVNDRQKLKGIMRVMEAAVYTLPIEIRGKIGNFSQILTMTDEKALDAVEAKIRKADAEFERYLKKEISAQVEKLLKRGKPKAEAGKKAVGKDADMHALFAAAEAAQGMNADAVAGEMAKLDALLASDSITPEQETLLTTQRGLVELFGDWKHADAARMEAALETLRYIHTDRWLKWKLAEIEHKERRAGMRHAFISGTGKEGTKNERQAMEKMMASLLHWPKKIWLNLSSFGEVLRYSFGDHEHVVSLIDAERKASNQYEDEMQGLGEEISDLFTSMAGSTLAGEKLRYSLSQRTIKTPSEELSQLEAITALLMWDQDGGRRHMEGHIGEDGKPVGKWHYDQAWIDDVESRLTPEACNVMAFIRAQYAGEYATLNALYRQRYGVDMPAHANYSPISVTPMKAAKGEMTDPVTGAVMKGGSLLTPGGLRTRSSSAIAEPDFKDALQILVGHKKQMAYWKSYFDVLTEAQAILGNREVMNAAEAKAGEEAAVMVAKWIKILAEGGIRDSAAGIEWSRFLNKAGGNAAVMALYGKIGTLAVQSTQLAAASMQMPTADYAMRLGKLMSGNLGWADAWRSDFIQRRFKSAPPIVRQAMEQLAGASSPNMIKHIASGLGKTLSGADALFTAGTFAILRDYHLTTGAELGMKGKALEEYAEREAERATEEVAQPTRMANRSYVENAVSANPLARASFAYNSDARQKLVLVGWRLAKNPASVAKAALFLSVSSLMAEVIRNAWKDAKGDDDEKKWSVQRLAHAALVKPITAIPGLSEFLGDGSAFDGAKYGWKSAKDIYAGEGDAKDWMNLLKMAGYFNETAASLTGLANAGEEAAKVIVNAAE